MNVMIKYLFRIFDAACVIFAVMFVLTLLLSGRCFAVIMFIVLSFLCFFKKQFAKRILQRKIKTAKSALKELRISENVGNQALLRREKLRLRKKVKRCRNLLEQVKQEKHLTVWQLSPIGAIIIFVLFVLSGSMTSTSVSDPGEPADPGETTVNVDETSVPKSDTEDQTSEDTLDVSLEIDGRIHFILEEAQLEKDFSEELYQQVFFLSDPADEEMSLEEVRKMLLSENIDNDAEAKEKGISEISNSDLDVWLDYASRLEAAFIEGEKQTQIYAELKDADKWEKSLLHSSTLQEVIDERILVWDAGERTAELAFLISNAFQKLAYECDSQNADTLVVAAYYAESILWTQKAIGLSDQSQINMYYNYYKERYHDLRDLFSRAAYFSEEKEQAQGIYYILDTHKEDLLVDFE